jgi:hypothetical protein
MFFGHGRLASHGTGWKYQEVNGFVSIFNVEEDLP